MLDQLRLRILCVHAGRDSQVDAGACLVGHRGRRADHGWAVDAEHGGCRSRPQRVRHFVAQDVDAVEHACVLAQLLEGVGRTRPLLRAVEATDRRVAPLVAHGVEHADERSERVRCGAAEHARVHGALKRPYGHPDPGHPAQARGQGRHADRDVPRVADENRVGAKQVGVLHNERLETAGSLLLGSLADDLQRHGRLPPQRAQGGQVGGQVPFAVGGAAPVPTVVPRGQLPGWATPSLRRPRAARRDGSRGGPSAPPAVRDLAGDGLAPVGGLVGADVLDADARERVDRPLDHPLALLGLAAVRDRPERDRSREVLPRLRHQGLDLFAESVLGHGPLTLVADRVVEFPVLEEVLDVGPLLGAVDVDDR